MKNKTLSGIVLAILGALISFMPKWLMDEHCINARMNCFWSGKAELGIGLLIVILALLLIYFESKEIRMGINLSLALIGIFSALITSVLIGFCGGSCGAKCTCSPAATYIMTGLGVLVTILSCLNLFQLNKIQLKKNKK